MADNIQITQGSGTTIKTDQLVGGDHVQYIKLLDGTADSTAIIAGDATNGLDVDVTRVQGSVTVIDGGGSLTVDGTVTANTGLSQPLTDTQLRATAVPVSLAIVPSHAVTNAGTFAVQVSSALPAGTNNIGNVDIASIATGTNNIGKVDSPTTTPAIYNVTLTSADIEYSQAMPSNCRGFEFQCRGAVDIRFAFVTGKVAAPTAPWMTLKSGQNYSSYQLAQGGSPSTLYLASSNAGAVVEILAWS